MLNEPAGEGEFCGFYIEGVRFGTFVLVIRPQQGLVELLVFEVNSPSIYHCAKEGDGCGGADNGDPDHVDSFSDRVRMYHHSCTLPSRLYLLRLFTETPP